MSVLVSFLTGMKEKEDLILASKLRMCCSSWKGKNGRKVCVINCSFLVDQEAGDHFKARLSYNRYSEPSSQLLRFSKS